MSSVYHNHLIACTLSQCSSLSISLHDIGNLLLRKSSHRLTVGTDPIAGPPLAKAGFLVLIGHIGARILSGVRKLYARNGTMTAYAIGHKGMCSKVSYNLKIKVQHVTGIGVGMYHQFTYCHCSCPTLGTKFIKALSARARTTVGCDICCTHRCRKHAVSKRGPAQGDRTGK